MYDPKLQRRPFMTLNVSVVGKYHETLDDLRDRNNSILYKIDENDPNILTMNSASVVSILLGFMQTIHKSIDYMHRYKL